MHRLLSSLHEDHVNIAKLLSLLEDEIEKFDAEQNPDYQCMTDIMRYMTHYPDMHHHPNEELIFSRLAERSPSSHEDIDHLSEEHKKLAQHGLSFLDDLDAVTSGAIIHRDKLAEDAHAYVEMLKSHMRKEEGDVFPLAQALLTEEDWNRLETQIETVRDPLFGPNVDNGFKAVFDAILQRE